MSPLAFKKLLRMLAYIDNGKPAAARFASTFTRSALDATATLSPLLLHCYVVPCIFLVP